MSKIGNYNLILQEQAEELGFSTTQEALDNGYEVVEKQNGEPYLAQFLSAEEEQEEAHKAWLEERDSVIDSLSNAIYHNRRDNDWKGTYEQTVMQRAKEFIEKGEV